MTNPKTKRNRAAGRAHRHTAIQGIINNHQGIIDDIASIDNSIASLQDETCNLGSRLDHWYTILDEKNIHTRQNVVENERKVAEIEPALALLQEFTKQQVTINAKQDNINTTTHRVQKNHQEAIAQLIAYTNKVHEKQTNLNRELNHTRAAVDEVRDDLMWFGLLLIGLSATTILAYLILFLIVIAK